MDYKEKYLNQLQQINMIYIETHKFVFYKSLLHFEHIDYSNKLHFTIKYFLYIN